MDSYITGKTIKKLRESNRLTQSSLAELLGVSDKTISKWETGRGLPDVTMLEPLADALFVSVAELMAGEKVVNGNVCANMAKINFYVCPICGNVFFSSGAGVVGCCGVTLPPLEAEECDVKHLIRTETVENEIYLSLDHPMTKEHYISFLAKVNGDRVEIIKLYPEGNAEGRFFNRGRADLYAYCNKHGLFRIKYKC